MGGIMSTIMFYKYDIELFAKVAFGVIVVMLTIREMLNYLKYQQTEKKGIRRRQQRDNQFF